MSHFGRPLRATESRTFLPHAIPGGAPCIKRRVFWIPRSPDSISVISRGIGNTSSKGPFSIALLDYWGVGLT